VKLDKLIFLQIVPLLISTITNEVFFYKLPLLENVIIL
jgi:hypothetical protein